MSDERAHPAAGRDGWWYDLAVAPAGPTLAVQLVSGERWRYRAALVRGDELVVVVDDDVPPPRPGSLELRTHGLWAEHFVEVPFDHVSVGCEAFALRIDADPGAAAPLDLTAALVGDLVPFGLDLGWETDGPVERHTGDGTRGGYEVPCLVYGEVLVGDERIALDATPGRRGHVWGPPAGAGDGWLTTSPLPPVLAPVREPGS